jgi:hypothetical protein
MNRIQLVAPGRLQIREGGGCAAVFGVPFLAGGIFVILIVFGGIPLSNADELPALAWPFLILMAIAFTAVGGVLVFGRSWTTIDRSQHQVVKQWGLLIPMRERSVSLRGYTEVTLEFVEGDSDTADQFSIALKAHTGANLPLCSFSDYAQARACARAVAEHLQLDLEDASTDHPSRSPAGQFDVPLQDRRRHEEARTADLTAPPGARSQVTHQGGEVTIVIPVHRMHPLGLVWGLVPVAIALLIGPPLATFFRETRTPPPVAWAFLGFLTLCFGILPVATVLNGFVRSRRGATIVVASRQGLHIQERSAWKARTVARFDASEILDVDYSSLDSSLASAKRAAELKVRSSYPWASSTISPRVERIMNALTRFATGKGVTVKTRNGLTTFGQGLDDAEVRYLHAVVRRALIE